MERGASRTITYVGFLLAVILVVGAALVAYRNQRLYQQTVAIEAHTYVVLETATEFLNRMLQGESSTRGYVLTGDQQQRLDGEDALIRATPLLDSLVALTRDNPVQQARLARIAPLAARRADLIHEIATARDAARGVTKQIESVVFSGDAVMHQLRKELVQFKLEELRLLDLRTQATQESAGRALSTALVGVGLAILILLAALSITFRELRERERVEGELQHEGERQAVMIEMQQAIATATAGDQEVLDLIVEQAMHLTGADGAMLALLDADDDHYTVRSALGNVSDWRGRRMELQGSIIGWVTAHREATMIPDAYADARVDQRLVRSLANRSLVILPILEGERAVGALLSASQRVDAFTHREFAVLKIMSGILSAGVTNAAAFEANERLLAELRQSRDAAEAANQSKSAFLATMSHELRTPLNSVIGFANLLHRNRAGNLAPADLQFLERIRDNGTHLLHLINDILDVSKIEAGRMEVHPVPTDLAPLIQETIAQLGGPAGARAVDVRGEVPDGLQQVEIDPARLKQVLINLIGNALKFTEQGSVTVRVVADAARHPLRIDVIDTGIGISPDRMEAVFEAFTQAEATTERRFGGTGLGLTISRSLLRLMGADLKATSAPGQGSTFTITLPATLARATTDLARQHETPRPLPGTVHAPLILIVDDDPHTLELFGQMLGADGYRVRTALDGLEAFKALETETPDLILLDLMMPVMAGATFLAALRADPRYETLPVVVATSLDADSEAVRRLDGTAQAVIHKGPEIEQTLRAVVQKVLGA